MESADLHRLSHRSSYTGLNFSCCTYFVDTNNDNTMDTENLLPLLEQLDDNVDDLEDVLQPLLGSSLNKMSKNMPIMDKAKIHVLTTYALESLIFCKLDFRKTHKKRLLRSPQLIYDFGAWTQSSTRFSGSSHALGNTSTRSRRWKPNLSSAP